MFLIKEELASTTISKRLQTARMFFQAAVDREIIDKNPFAKVSAQAVIPDERKCFVSREDIDKVIAVSNPTWQVIISLCRYGGLRCPSEVLSLRWCDID